MLPSNPAKRLACVAAAAMVMAGCLFPPAEEHAPDASTSEATHTLGEQTQERPGVPRGCTRVWSSAAADSVLNCPDVRPPAPR